MKLALKCYLTGFLTSLVFLQIVLIDAQASPTNNAKNAPGNSGNAPGNLSRCKTVEGLVMQRVDGLGPALFQVSPAGVKIDYKTAQYCILCKAPDWKVTWYSTPNKTIFSESIKEFRLEKQLPPNNPASAPPPARATYIGLKAIRVSKKTDVSEQGFFKFSSQQPRPLLSDYYFSEPVKLSQEAHNFISTFFGIPNFGCMPLGFDIHESGGTTRQVYFTTKLEKAQIPISEFDVPKNFTKVTSKSKVISGAGYGKDMDNLMEDMGLGEKFGTKK